MRRSSAAWPGRLRLPLAAGFDYVVVNDDFRAGRFCARGGRHSRAHRRPRMVDLEKELIRLDTELGRILDRRE